jgi:hypothetical protein
MKEVIFQAFEATTTFCETAVEEVVEAVCGSFLHETEMIATIVINKNDKFFMA